MLVTPWQCSFSFMINAETPGAVAMLCDYQTGRPLRTATVREVATPKGAILPGDGLFRIEDVLHFVRFEVPTPEPRSVSGTLFRYRRATYEDGMATTVEVADRAALDALLQAAYPDAGRWDVRVEAYRANTRNGWDDECTVFLNDEFIGFSSGPLP